MTTGRKAQSKHKTPEREQRPLAEDAVTDESQSAAGLVANAAPSHDLLAHPTAHVLRQAIALQRQRTAGNAHVQRLLRRSSTLDKRRTKEVEKQADHPLQPTIIEDLSIQFAPGHAVAQREGAAQPADAAVGPRPAAAASLVVDDDAETVGPNQMRKSEFLAQLRPAVTATAEVALASVGRSARDCPYIEQAFAFYAGQSGQHIERALRRYAPEAAAATRAHEYIPFVCERVRQGVATWAATGEVTGVPDDLMGGGMLGSIVAGAGRALSAIGNLLFKSRAGGARADASPQAVQMQLGAGRPLDGGAKSRMESAFGQDFSQVRVHTDGAAAGLSSELNARAFTVGADVAFGAGEYQPGTPIGDALIAHELAHVAQQGSTAEVMQKGDGAYDALEEDADRSAVGAVAALWGGARGIAHQIGKSALPSLRSGLRLQRCSRTSQEYEEHPEDYHGAGGWLHSHVYEPLQEDYSSWMSWGEDLPAKWGEKVPIGGQIVGGVVGFVPWALGGAMKIVVGVPQFVTPKTEEEHFLTVMTMGAGTPAVRLKDGVKYGWWWVRNLFARNPAVESAIERQSPGLVEKVIEKAEEKAPAVVKEVAAKATGKASSLPATTAESVTDKLTRYLLNPDHPEGGSKARWFREALGFSKDNIDDLARQIVFDPSKAVQTEITEHGVKFNQVINITGANGKRIDVTFAWIQNNDGVVRLITAIPSKK